MKGAMTAHTFLTAILSLMPHLVMGDSDFSQGPLKGKLLPVTDGHIEILTNDAANMKIDFYNTGNPARASVSVDAWGVGIRKGSRVVNTCGAIQGGDVGGDPDLRFLELTFDRVRGKNGGKTFDSRVLCGASKALRVRHQLRSASRRKGCKGAYEIKVTIENLTCGTLPSVRYRRSSGMGASGGGEELLTIQGEKAKKPKVAFASSNRNCPRIPDDVCTPEGSIPLPAILERTLDPPDDGGSVVELDLGKLKKGQRATFYMYYGTFTSLKGAKKCLKGARIETHTLVTDSKTKDTALFGIRKSLSKGKFKNKKCVKFRF